MSKHIIAVVVGFILWSVCWLSYNFTLMKLDVLPADQSQPVLGMAPLLALLFGSVVISLVSGYVAARIAPAASSLPVLVLGLLLLAVGIVFQSQSWRLMPLWYHLSFMALLIPFCYLGAWLHRM